MNRREPYIGMPINFAELDENSAVGTMNHPKESVNAGMANPKCHNPHENMQPMVLAMAYVPWQKWKKTYDYKEGLQSGTIFPELNLPFLGYQGGMRK